jgi:hypothetical protein
MALGQKELLYLLSSITYYWGRSSYYIVYILKKEYPLSLEGMLSILYNNLRFFVFNTSFNSVLVIN